MRLGIRDWLGLRRGHWVHSRVSVNESLGVDNWKAVVHDLRTCADNGLCADCGQEPKWACDWDLMRKAADVIEAMAKEMGLK